MGQSCHVRDSRDADSWRGMDVQTPAGLFCDLGMKLWYNMPILEVLVLLERIWLFDHEPHRISNRMSTHGVQPGQYVA